MNNFGVTEIEQGQNTGHPLGGYTHYLYLKNVMINRYKDKMADGGMMAKGGWIKFDKQEDFYYYSTPDKKIKTPFWYSVHEVKDIGSKKP